MDVVGTVAKRWHTACFLTLRQMMPYAELAVLQGRLLTHYMFDDMLVVPLECTDNCARVCSGGD